MRRLHGDGAKEIISSSEMQDICLQRSIEQTTSAPYTQAQNRVAERSWRSVIECARTMMIETKMNKQLWPYAMRAATQLLNVRPTKANDMASPHQIVTGEIPDISNLRVLGCKVHVLIHTHQNKLSEKTWTGVFVGYDHQSKAYLVFNPRTKEVTRTVHLTFDEGADGDESTAALTYLFSSLAENHEGIPPVDAKPEEPTQSDRLKR